MTAKKLILISLAFVLLAGMPAQSLAYGQMEANELKARLDAGKPTILVDIQPKNAYNERHFYGAIRTFAYPAKSETDTDSLVQAVRMYDSTGNDVVIIGPRGAKAEERALDFLVSRGIPEGKLFILKGGINSWPYKDMLLRIEGGLCY